MELYLIRHTAVAVAPGTCYGQSDVPLAASFAHEAKAVREALRRIGPANACYTSPLKRCVALATACGYSDAILDARLSEQSYGAWELRKWNDIDMGLWEERWDVLPPPGGESLPEVTLRIQSLIEEAILQGLPRIFAFTHGGVMGCAKAYIRKIPLREAFAQKAAYGAIEGYIL